MVLCMYIHRACEETIKKINDTFPVLLVTGPRQVGKSTVLAHMAEENRTIVSLDDVAIRALAKSDPVLFFQRYQPPLMIDEIQYAPELLPYIKIMVDKEKENGMFWLTGSQAFHFMHNISESLAGRVGILQLLGLSSDEINETNSQPYQSDPQQLLKRMQNQKRMSSKDIFQRIFTGSMPRLYENENVDWEMYYNGYVNTYLQRDVKELTQVVDESQFLNFLIVVAARTSRPVVYKELADEVGISVPTAKRWLSILISSHIVALVQPYFNNRLKRVVKMPLLHFLDTGLCTFLLKWNHPDVLESGAMSGQFFESYVFSEIYKSYLNAGKIPPIYYYRDKQKKEIDLLIVENGIVYPIEIKKSGSPGNKAIKNFHVLKPLEAESENKYADLKMEIGYGSVICMMDDMLPIDEKKWFVPVWVI